MSSLLVIHASPMGDASISRRLTQSFVKHYTQAHAGVQVVERDVSAQTLPYFDAKVLGALFAKEEARTKDQQAHIERVDALIEEFKQADAIVMGVPMHNFAIPAYLKSYLDHLAQAGKTFKYSENGPVGLVDDKPVYLIATRGGNYSADSGLSHMDFTLPYLKTFFAFLGITSVHTLEANGLAMGEDAVAKAIDQAETEIEKILAA